MKKGADPKKDATRTLSAKKDDKKAARVKIKREEIPNLLKNLQFNIRFY